MTQQGGRNLEIETILGNLVSGFATKIYAAGAAVWVFIETSEVFTATMHTVSGVFAAIP